MKPKRPTKPKALQPAKPGFVGPSQAVAGGREVTFREVVGLIQDARGRALRAVNTELVELYWRVGEFISGKIETAAWGEGVVEELARFIARRHPDIKGFTRASLFRMRQFFDIYRREPIVAPLVRQLPWTHNLLILGRCKRAEEREFYLRLAVREKWGKRELERQLNGALFERAVLAPPKVSPLVTQLHPAAGSLFKDTYLLDFLDLPDGHSEGDLQRGLVGNLKRFLIELGRDFAFVGEQYVLQVGGRDFRLDLLFFHRELQCLVAIELKIEEFQPEHLGKLEFYLEVLDRDVRKPHERPSIGVLLCATKDNEGRVCPEPHRLAGAHRGVSNATTRPDAAAAEAARVLRTGAVVGRNRHTEAQAEEVPEMKPKRPTKSKALQPARSGSDGLLRERREFIAECRHRFQTK